MKSNIPIENIDIVFKYKVEFVLRHLGTSWEYAAICSQIFQSGRKKFRAYSLSKEDAIEVIERKAFSKPFRNDDGTVWGHQGNDFEEYFRAIDIPSHLNIACLNKEGGYHER